MGSAGTGRRRTCRPRRQDDFCECCDCKTSNCVDNRKDHYCSPPTFDSAVHRPATASTLNRLRLASSFAGLNFVQLLIFYCALISAASSALESFTLDTNNNHHHNVYQLSSGRTGSPSKLHHIPASAFASASSVGLAREESRKLSRKERSATKTSAEKSSRRIADNDWAVRTLRQV